MRASRSLALCLSLFICGCSTTSYLFQQGRGQLHILRARRRIADVLLDPAVTEDTKARLRLALRAREFGVTVLGLRGGDGFTRFLDTGDDPIAWSVYAAWPDRLEPFLHHFPITGAIPYLGFFEKAAAEKEKARLEAQGLDTFLVAVAGYSTLGFTADPIYSSMIDGPPERIVEVVLHEMLHGTVYRPGHSEWNESLATVVGYEGAAAFFRSEEVSEGAVAEVQADALAREERDQTFSAFLKPVIAQLEALYAQPISKEEKLRLRAPIFEQAMSDYRALFPPKKGEEKKPKAFTRQRLNNAVILSFTTYHRSTPALRRELQGLNGDLTAFIALYRRRYGN